MKIDIFCHLDELSPLVLLDIQIKPLRLNLEHLCCQLLIQDCIYWVQYQNNTFKIESLLHAPDTRLFPMHPSIVARTKLFFFFCCFALSTSSPAPLPHPFLHCCQSSFSSSLPEQDQFVRFLVISDSAQIVQCTYYCPFPSILSKYHPLSFPDSASHLRCDFGTLLLVLTKMS